jgi:AAA domain-containing protein
MTIKAESQAEKTVIERLRGIIAGQYKVGKSWLAATGRDPVLFIDPDLRADSLAGKPGVFTLSPMEPPGQGMQPEAYNDILRIVGNLEKSRVLGDIDPKFALHPRAKEKIQTLVLDSAQSTSRAIIQYNMYTNPKVLAREIKIGGQRLLFPSGWDTWNSDMECMEQLVARIVAIPEIDFFMTFHEEEKDGSITLFPNRHRPIARYFNEVWRLTRKQEVPELQLVPTINFTACTTLKGAPGVVQNPNIKSLVEQYGRR